MKKCERCYKEAKTMRVKIYGFDFMDAVLCEKCDEGITRYVNGAQLEE
jgi:hypothetical protein